MAFIAMVALHVGKATVGDVAKYVGVALIGWLGTAALLWWFDRRVV